MKPFYTATVIIYVETCLNGGTSFKFIDHKSGCVSKGKISGGESNIRGIARCWNPKINDWDRSLLFIEENIAPRQYNHMVKDMPYAGCRSDDIVKYIKTELKQKKKELKLKSNC